MADPDEHGAQAGARAAPAAPPGSEPRDRPPTDGAPRRARRAVAAAAAAPLAFAAARAAAEAQALFGVTLGAPALGPPPALLAATPLRRALGADPIADALAALAPVGPEVLAAVAALAAALRLGLARRTPGPRAAAAAVLWSLAAALLLGLEVPRRRALVAAVAAAAVVAAAVRALAPRARRSRSGAATATAATIATAALGLAAVWMQSAAARAPLRSGADRAAPVSVTAPAGARSIVLLTLDTTRRDALGCYGASPRATPHLDALARRSVVYERAVSPSPHTHPAMASLVTGLPPLAHGSLSGAPALGDVAITLAEHLAARGYQTAGFLDNPWLWGGFGLERGYAHLERRADLARIERWLDGATGAPFLLHVHLFHPHGPYVLRPDARAALTGGAPRPAAAARIGDRVDARVIRASECPASHAFTADEIAWMREIQASETRAMDGWIGRFLAALDARGILEACVLVVAADHGEEFGERGGLHHSHTLFGELVDVPLFALAPGLTPGREPEMTSLEEVPRIALELAGVPRMERRIEPADPGGLALSVRARQGGRHLLRARGERWSLHARVTPRPAPESGATVEYALFDLDLDPGEREDVAAARPRVVARLTAVPAVADSLEALAALPLRPAGAASAPERPRAAADLDALGYAR